MKKLFQTLGLIACLPVVLSSPVVMAQVLAAMEPSTEAVEESLGALETGSCQLSAMESAELASLESPSFIEQFGPSSLAALRAASCPETLDLVSRELLLAALARMERVDDAETQITMLLGLAEIYQTLELPQTLPLLDYLFEQSQALDAAGTRLHFAVALAHRYASFRNDEKTPVPQEQRVMAAAAKQIVQLNFGDGDEPSPAEGADIFAVAQWYSEQDDLATARQLVSHIDQDFERDLFQQNLEEAYAFALEHAGEQAAADRHRRENLSPENLAAYAEAKAHERMAALAETLPAEGEAIDGDQLKTLQKNVDKLEVPWAKYTYGQMVARQLIIQGQYEAALETLAQAPVPMSEDYEIYDYYEEEAESGETPDPTTLEIELGFESAQLLPAILATDVAADGYVNEALAFIDHLPEEDSTRLFQRAMLLSGISVFHQVEGQADGTDGAGDVYLEEAIALAQDLPEQPANASLWVLISLAQRWHSDDTAADQSMEKAIAIAPALDSVNDDLLAELEKDPWIIDEEVIAATEEYGSIRDFYEALHEQDLEAAEVALAETEDVTVVVSMQGSLAAAYSKAEQPDKAVQLLSELFDLRSSEELLEHFGEADYLLRNMISSFASGNGDITTLQAALAGLTELDQEQQDSLLLHALEIYSYSQVHEVTAVEELMARRDVVLSLEDERPIREQMLRSLATSLATHGHFSEAIAFLPEFDLKDQAYGLVALTDLYLELTTKPDIEMRQQLQAQIQDLVIPDEEAELTPEGEAAMESEPGTEAAIETMIESTLSSLESETVSS